MARSARAAIKAKRPEDKVSNLLRLLDSLRNDEEGAAMTEYVVLLGIIAAGMVTVLTAFSGVLQSKFAAICTALGSTC
jgi:pilus assembly protein Flp/PilA